jgi:hypothetical protein
MGFAGVEVDEKDRVIFEYIAKDIRRIADTMTAPKAWYQKVTEILLALVGIGGGVFIADQVIKWIKG